MNQNELLADLTMKQKQTFLRAGKILSTITYKQSVKFSVFSSK